MSEGAAAAARPRGRRFDPGVALVALLALAFGAPQLDARVLPVHDTFYSFVNFNVFYNAFFFERELAHWLPYSDFGLPADLQQIISLTPVSYLTGLVGALADVTDTLLLFKLSVLGEHVVFAVGSYLLARRLFPSRATALALGVAAAGTVVWYAQLWFELRFFYLLPWVLYGAISFLEEGRGAWLWGTAVACVAWSLGNVPYFVPLWGFVLLLCLGGAALGFRGPWSAPFARTLPNLVLLGAFVLAAGVYAAFALHALDGLVMTAPGRNPLTGQVDVETFRSYGGKADLATVARSFLLGRPVHLPWGSGADNSAYVGLLPLAGVGLAVAFERGRIFLGVAAALVALVWLSLGGVFATLVYHLPALSQYRHVGLVYGLVKALALVAAGFGLERLWRLRLRLPSQRALWVSTGALALASGALVPLLWDSPLLLRLWLYALASAASLALTRAPQAGLVTALALDLAIYQAAVYRQLPKLPPAYAETLDTVHVHELRYQPRRYPSPAAAPPSPEMERAQRALRLARHPGAMEIYWITYGFAQFDPCRSRFLSEMKTRGVARLVRVERQRGRPLRELTGCGAPKLRLVAGATLVDDPRAARDALLAASGASAAPDVIEAPDGVRPPSPPAPLPEAGRARVVRFGFDELVAEVHVAVPEGAWLVYADAIHPGWRATVDGRDAAVLAANLAFKAVRVPGGDHVVRLWYRRDPSHAASYALAAFGVASGLALLAGLGLAAFPRARPG